MSAMESKLSHLAVTSPVQRGSVRGIDPKSLDQETPAASAKAPPAPAPPAACPAPPEAAATGLDALGPAWTRGELERPAGEKDMGGWKAAVFTEEQQARLGIDAEGHPAPTPVARQTTQALTAELLAAAVAGAEKEAAEEAAAEEEAAEEPVASVASVASVDLG